MLNLSTVERVTSPLQKPDNNRSSSNVLQSAYKVEINSFIKMMLSLIT